MKVMVVVTLKEKDEKQGKKRKGERLKVIFPVQSYEWEIWDKHGDSFYFNIAASSN